MLTQIRHLCQYLRPQVTRPAERRPAAAPTAPMQALAEIDVIRDDLATNLGVFDDAAESRGIFRPYDADACHRSAAIRGNKLNTAGLQ